MNAVSHLSSLVNQLAEDTGGQHVVEVWCWVVRDPKRSDVQINSICGIGPTGSQLVSANGDTPEAAYVKCMEKFLEMGSPKNPVDVDLNKLKEKAEGMGYELVAKQPVAA